jgi:hypothetical protein
VLLVHLELIGLLVAEELVQMLLLELVVLDHLVADLMLVPVMVVEEIQHLKQLLQEKAPDRVVVGVVDTTQHLLGQMVVPVS